ncbi:hypothetical protein [Paraburkholderia rhizosphaerae]|uniref:Uncharacterized protein n=1 Tax=Paraburkholderia rhizosphaerae TaxID=480658 RepID=A0A4R8M1W8_9BURK|nr:hypothetical protein [Paraburkholderia rhizosphaerae]TDY54130.1 hypothetical protein BX592_102277 [Paraburkholderia rhizosphaerae]
MATRKKASGEGGTPVERPSIENGFFYIEDQQEGEAGTDFDWFPKDPSMDPPAGQYRLSEDARTTYSWCVDFVKDDEQYRDFIGRLRKIVFGGLVCEPIARDARKRLDQLDDDLVNWANDQIRPHLLKSIKLRLTCMLLMLLVGLALSIVSTFQLASLGNWILLLGTASGATAALMWHRIDIEDLSVYRTAMTKATHHEIDFMISLVMVLGVAFVVQNKWITLQLGGTALEISGSAPGALAIGFVLGLLSDKLMQLISPTLERVSRAFKSAVSKNIARSKAARQRGSIG